MFISAIGVFFAFGYYGVERLTAFDAIDSVKNLSSLTYAPNPVTYSIYTMTPAYIIGAIIVSLWVFFLVTGYFNKKGFLFKFIVLLFIVMGVMVWFYSIF